MKLKILPTKALSITLISIFSIGFVFAQDDDDIYNLSLEDLLNMDVISASKVSEKQTDAPGIIQVITSEEIERFGALNLAEVLDRVTGAMNVSSNLYPQNVFSVRGDLSSEFDTHQLLLINGRPMRETVYGGFNSPIYLSFPINIIDKIEVIRGPGSVLYGSNAYTGVVNIITKKESETSGSAQFTAGSFGTTDISGDVTYVNEDLSVTAAFKNYTEDGWNFEATDILGTTASTDYSEENQSFALLSNYKNFTFNAVHMTSEQRTFGIVLPVWSNGLLKSRRETYDLGYEHEWNEKISSNVNVTHNRFGLEYKTVNGTTFDLSDDGSKDWLFEVSNYYKPMKGLNVLFGGTYYRQAGEMEIQPGVFLIPEYNKTWYSAYTQIDYRIIDNVKLIAGGQFNSIEGLDNDFVPRLGLVYNITDNIGVKGLWGQSFRAPYAVENTTNLPGRSVGNPDLNAEKLTNLDFQLFYTGSKIEVYATYFNYTSDELISQVQQNPGTADQTTTFVNFSEGLKGSGFSIETKYIPNEKILVTGSYSHQKNEVEFGGITIEDFTTAPNDLLKIGVSYQTTDKGFTIGLFNSYISAFNTGKSELVTTADVNGSLSSINLLTANISFNIPKLLNLDIKQDAILSFYATNVLDQEVNYADFTTGLINSIPGRAGAAYYGSLKVRF
ncbi:TonB-dependent receptor plug domain-containing protein [Ekhidna sp.]